LQYYSSDEFAGVHPGCGFVVFVLKKYQGIQMPHLLPLGSFTWSVQACTPETKKRKREEECLFRYDVQPIHPNVSVDDLYVYNFQTPRVQHEQCLPSPLDSLLGSIRNIKEMQLKIEHVVKWNSVKHITTPERVDIPKDQTTDGLSLLDDFRHYCVGNTPSTSLSKQYMMINGPRGVAARNDPSVTRDNWIKRFSFNEAIEEPAPSMLASSCCLLDTEHTYGKYGNSCLDRFFFAKYCFFFNLLVFGSHTTKGVVYANQCPL